MLQLRSTDHESILDMRREKVGTLHVPVLPMFHQHLAGHAEAFALTEDERAVGYALLLFDKHEGHDHVTLIELHLRPRYVARYEDAVDLVTNEYAPQVYLARTDDCAFETALIAHGLQMQVSTGLMVASSALDPGPANGLALIPLDYPHLRQVQDLYLHSVGPEYAPTVSELERAMDEDEFWVLTKDGQTIGLIIREELPGTPYVQLDLLAPHSGDREQIWALLTAGKEVVEMDLIPSVVVDARDLRKHEIFRKAGYYTAATYLVFYDPEAGRPKVEVIGREQLWAMIQAGDKVRIVDVMGEDHWKRGHLPRSEWLDYRSLSREARKRFKKDEPIVLYCNDYTCEAGAIAADKLRQLGYTNVRDYAGGIEDWLDAGLPIEVG